MINIKDFMNIVDYRITEGSEYGWRCFGSYAYCLDSWNGEYDGYTISIVFDTQTQTVYEAEAWDYARNRVYRLRHPDYVAAYDAEAKQRGIDPNQAMKNDDGTPLKYIDLEVEEDWLDKAGSIVQGLDYDTRVQMPITLPDDALFRLMQLAHEQDLTLNQFMENILRDEIDRIQLNQDLAAVEDKPVKKTKKKKQK